MTIVASVKSTTGIPSGVGHSEPGHKTEPQQPRGMEVRCRAQPRAAGAAVNLTSDALPVERVKTGEGQTGRVSKPKSAIAQETYAGRHQFARSRGDEGPPPGTALIPSRSLGGSVAPASLLCALLSSPTPNRSRSLSPFAGIFSPCGCLKLARALTRTHARQGFDCGSGKRAPCGEREYRWSPLPSI
jgi:hypothetical protein